MQSNALAVDDPGKENAAKRCLFFFPKPKESSFRPKLLTVLS